MSEDNVREMWSDDQLDEALATLRSEVATEPEVLRGTRAHLLAGAGEVRPADRAPTRARWAILAAAAATVAAVVAGVLVTGRDPGQVTGPPASEAKDPVAKIRAVDEPVRPGQFRYLLEHQWWSTSFDSKYVWKSEYRYEVWVPARERQEWMERRETTGRSELLNGSEEQAIAEGLEPPERTVETYRAPCGDYFAADDGRRPCEFVPSFAHPNQEYMASLTRDPDELLALLREQTEGSTKFTPDSLAFQFVTLFLREEEVPADLRMAFYRTLAKLPDIEITENVPNLDGRRGTSFAVGDQSTRRAIIVDPGTGQVIGERQTALAGNGDRIRPGTVLADSSLTSVVVDGMGVRPAG